MNILTKSMANKLLGTGVGQQEDETMDGMDGFAEAGRFIF